MIAKYQNLLPLTILFNLFEWDVNGKKNSEKHGVEQSEAESLFDDPERVLGFVRTMTEACRYFDKVGCPFIYREDRYFIRGRTKTGRQLQGIFMLRNQRIRFISVREYAHDIDADDEDQFLAKCAHAYKAVPIILAKSQVDLEKHIVLNEIDGLAIVHELVEC